MKRSTAVRLFILVLAVLVLSLCGDTEKSAGLKQRLSDELGEKQ